MKQEKISFLIWVTCVCRKMLLKFGDDFCTACEPIAWIWHKGNDPMVTRHPTAIIAVVDLREIHAIRLVHRNTYTITILLTVLAVLNVLLLAAK